MRTDFTNYVHGLPPADYYSYLGNEKPGISQSRRPHHFPNSTPSISRIRHLTFPLFDTSSFPKLSSGVSPNSWDHDFLFVGATWTKENTLGKQEVIILLKGC